MIISKLKYIEGKWLIPICLFLLLSCQDSSDTHLSLLGKWKIDSAERNDKPTLTLEDAFIDFKNDSILTTNILRKEIDSPYTFKKKQIVQSRPMEIIYDINIHKEDSLILSSTIRGYNFRFFLSRDSTDLKL